MAAVKFRVIVLLATLLSPVFYGTTLIGRTEGWLNHERDTADCDIEGGS